MRHSETNLSLPLSAEIKNEFCEVDIKDEDLKVEDFDIRDELTLPLNECLDSIVTSSKSDLNNQDVFLPSSFQIQKRSRRKPLQPQRNSLTENDIFDANADDDDFASIVSDDEYNKNLIDRCERVLDEEISNDNSSGCDNIAHETFSSLNQDAEQEMFCQGVLNYNLGIISGEEINSFLEIKSELSNVAEENITHSNEKLCAEGIDNEESEKDDETEDDQGSDDGVPDMETDKVFKREAGGIELNEEMKKIVNEEWKAHWGVKCNVCSEVFVHKTQFESHYIETHSAKPVYTCSYCNKTVNKYTTFRSHCYRHITENRHKCEPCNKGFSLKSMLKLHTLARHTAVKPFICEECGKSFVTKNGLGIHLEKHRTTQREDFPCTVCRKVLHTRGGLTAHMNVHKLGRRFMCDKCGKTFTQKVNMQQHVKQHTGERPHKCDKCGKCFAEKSHLTRHYSFHSETRPYKCEVCKKMYKTERCLKVHSQVHAESRPHICVQCNKGFLSSTKLKQHNNIHTGDRPFKCDYCEKSFTNYPNWLKHTRRRHKVDHKTGLNLVPKQEQAPKEEIDTGISVPLSQPTDLVDTLPILPLLTNQQTISQTLPDFQIGVTDSLLLDFSRFADHGLSSYTSDELRICLQTNNPFDFLANPVLTNSMGLTIPYQHSDTLTTELQPQPAHQNHLNQIMIPPNQDFSLGHHQNQMYSEQLSYIHPPL